MDDTAADLPVNEWEVSTVHAWFSSLGFSQYEHQLEEHGISGVVLCSLDSESLKDLGVSSVGHRLAILKAIYHLKLSDNIPIESGDYIPPSEVEEKKEANSVDRLHELVKEQGDRLSQIEQDNRRLQERLQVCLEELGTLSRTTNRSASDEERTLKKQPSMKWAPITKPTNSPTRPVPDGVASDSPHASPQQAEHEIPPPYRSGATLSTQERMNAMARGGQIPQTSATSTPPSGSGSQPKTSTTLSRGDATTTADNLKSFKVSLEDPAWKVLPAALKKYKINNDDWRNYAMFICYGNTERCLSLDEKPLLLFQRLKEAKKNPVFMLKHIKDIRSPIAVAQQKRQARLQSKQAESAVAGPSSTNGPPKGNAHPTVRSAVASSRNKNLATPQISTSTGPPSWPEVMSPVAQSKGDEAPAGGELSKSKLGSSTHVGDESMDTSFDVLDAKGVVSYAVAIYPYMAEQEDEFDVVVGDTFTILSRSRGWWVVQRDPTGLGTVELEISKQGWVPAGCLLETSVPVASAVAEANQRNGSSTGESPTSQSSRTPILPLSIISTSYPGIALMDYHKKGDEELDLKESDSLRVFKRYNHWSYAVKEEGGDRGWVPSWFIGKVSPSAGGPPPTPGASAQSLSSAPVTFESELRYADGTVNGQPQISPMSNAFPMAGRTATVV
ncbi:hypothetical protein SISNIDRAFT_453555 [Sistotremastrum niveocremeum HHB9708]|uniref:RA-domain-containing protein n=1 Tax=Sistotremastrum niveocremeum HHB9708 TaxID=1314777 RepID=A0A164VZA6_9AGAM|nr:hypothetical protein SISNIDRAFT_453555 [Sistotremastrum niveocremeum HHB9708]